MHHRDEAEHPFTLPKEAHMHDDLKYDGEPIHTPLRGVPRPGVPPQGSRLLGPSQRVEWALRLATREELTMALRAALMMLVEKGVDIDCRISDTDLIDVMRLISEHGSGHKITTIRALRTVLGLNLKDAKDIVDACDDVVKAHQTLDLVR